MLSNSPRGAEFGEAIAGDGACEQEFDAGEALRRFIAAEATVDFATAIPRHEA